MFALVYSVKQNYVGVSTYCINTVYKIVSCECSGHTTLPMEYRTHTVHCTVYENGPSPQKKKKNLKYTNKL